MTRLPETASLLAAAVLLAGFARGDDRKPVFPNAPRLATTQKELAAEKLRDDFAAKRAAAVKAAGSLIADPIALPQGHGSWIFYYDGQVSLRSVNFAARRFESPAAAVPAAAITHPPTQLLPNPITRHQPLADSASHPEKIDQPLTATDRQNRELKVLIVRL